MRLFALRFSLGTTHYPLPPIDPTDIPAIYNESRRIPRNIQAGSTDLDGFGDKQAAIRIGVASFQVTKRRYGRSVVRSIVYIYIYVYVYIYPKAGEKQSDVSCDSGGTLMFRVPISFFLLLLFLLSFTVSRRYRGYIQLPAPTFRSQPCGHE